MKQKGFTLVELLVTIVIIGIITGIALPLVRNIQAKNEERKYKTYADSMLAAAKLYNDSYSEDLFGHKEVGCAYITYNQMNNKDLLKDIQLNDISCNSKSTFVRVVKIKDKYSYSFFLGCGQSKKNASGELEASKVTISLPEKGKEYEIDSSYCSGVKENNLSVVANPDKKGSTYDKKKRKAALVITSATGINNQIDIQKSWYYMNGEEKVRTNFEKVDFKVIGNQEKKILDGELISSTSNELVTPNDYEGDVYLEVRVNQLSNLYGEKWKNEDDPTSNILTFGPYKVDNTAPVVSNEKVTSKEINYNSTKVKVSFDASDNLIASNKLKMCVKESGNNCSDSDYKAYTKDTEMTLSGSHDGKKRTIVIKLKDLAGNESSKSVDYVVASTIKYDGNGGSGSTANTYCNNNVDCTLRENSFTKKGYTFDGWYTAKTGGTKYGNTTKLNEEIRTVYAHWQINTVTIKLNSNTGNLASAHGNAYSLSGNSVLKNNLDVIHTISYNDKLSGDGLVNYNNPDYLNLEKRGYAAKSNAEWNSKSDGKGTSYDQSKSYKAEEFCSDIDKKSCVLTLYVNWEKVKYTITYDLDGGSVSENPKEYYVDTESFTLKNPTRTGYNFDGWTGSNGDTKQVTVTISKGSTGNKSYTAHWSLKSYTLTYDGNGATGGSTASSTCKHNQDCTLASNGFTKTGNHFDGWYTEREGGTKKTGSIKITGPTTLYAHWKPNVCTITYSPNSGTFGSHASETTQTLKYGESTPNMRNAKGGHYDASRTGYHLNAASAWISGSTTFNQDSGYSATDFCPNLATQNQSVTLSANWKVNVCTITYSANGGTFGDHADETVQTLNYNVSTGNMRNAKGGHYDASRTGYHLDAASAWILGSTTFNQDSTYNATDICTSLGSGNQSVTLKANWKKTAYTISYDLNSGSVSGNPGTYYVDTDTFTLKNPTKSSYTFAGWSGTNITGKSKSVSVAQGSTGNRSYTAHWCRNCASVDNGSCSLAVQNDGTCKYTTSCDHGYDISNNGKYNPTCTSTSYPMVCITFKTSAKCADDTVYDYRNAIEAQDTYSGLKSFEFDSTAANSHRSFPYGGTKDVKRQGWCSNNKNTTSTWTQIEICNQSNHCTGLIAHPTVHFGQNLCSSNSSQTFVNYVSTHSGTLTSTIGYTNEFIYYNK